MVRQQFRKYGRSSCLFPVLQVVAFAVLVVAAIPVLTTKTAATGWRYALLGSAAVFLLLCLGRELYRHNYHWWPAYRRLLRYGDPEAIFTELEEAVERGQAHVLLAGVIVTERYMLLARDLFLTAEVMWMYRRVSDNLRGLEVCLTDGTSRTVFIDCDTEHLQLIAQAVPHIKIGYDEDFAKLSPEERLLVWQERLRQ
jgi:hypothetical protein